MLRQEIHPPVEPRADVDPAAAGRAEVLERVTAARAREREALAGLEQVLHAAEWRYHHALERFQDFEAAFESRRSVLLQRERHGA